MTCAVAKFQEWIGDKKNQYDESAPKNKLKSPLKIESGSKRGQSSEPALKIEPKSASKTALKVNPKSAQKSEPIALLDNSNKSMSLPNSEPPKKKAPKRKPKSAPKRKPKTVSKGGKSKVAPKGK